MLTVRSSLISIGVSDESELMKVRVLPLTSTHCDLQLKGWLASYPPSADRRYKDKTRGGKESGDKVSGGTVSAGVSGGMTGD